MTEIEEVKVSVRSGFGKFCGYFSIQYTAHLECVNYKIW